ncbi:MAG: indole-3-glycerol phosphate synthase TrpC [Anaerolineae bacterium]
MEDILAHKRSAIARRKQAVPLNAVRAQARMQVRPLDIVSCLRDGRLSVIPHLQQASPELGLYVRQYDPVGLARLFEQNGAAAISVTTEERFYYGGMDHLTLVKRAVSVPVWDHDYVIDPYQIYEARAAGADGILLFPYVLDDDTLRALISLVQRLKMTEMALVRNEAEVWRVSALDPRVVAIATSDPVTQQVDMDLPARLRPLLPSHTTVLAMGGVRAVEDVQRIAAAGLDGVVVGYWLLTGGDRLAKLRGLLGLSAHPPEDPAASYRVDNTP